MLLRPPCGFRRTARFFMTTMWKVVITTGQFTMSFEPNMFIYQARHSLAWSQQGFWQTSFCWKRNLGSLCFDWGNWNVLLFNASLNERRSFMKLMSSSRRNLSSCDPIFQLQKKFVSHYKTTTGRVVLTTWIGCPIKPQDECVVLHKPRF